VVQALALQARTNIAGLPDSRSPPCSQRLPFAARRTASAHLKTWSCISRPWSRASRLNWANVRNSVAGGAPGRAVARVTPVALSVMNIASWASSLCVATCTRVCASA
jgi:hypothetical protein